MDEKRLEKTGAHIVEILQNIDVAVFYFINHNLANPLFDKFFVFITDVKHWILLYVYFWLYLIIKGGTKGKITAVVILLLIAASDQISSHLLKNLFERARPCNALENVRLLVSCSRTYSMPSSHAVNNFAVAAFLSALYSKYRKIFFTIATLVAFSRPYVGVHYFSDILVGALLGMAIGYVFVYVLKKINMKGVNL